MKTAKVFSAMLLAFLLLASTAVFAQTEKGEILLDGDFWFHSQSLEIDDADKTDVDSSILDIEIQAGYMVIDNLEIGLHLGIENESTDVKNPNWSMEDTNATLSYGVFGRYFFMPDNQLRPFAAASLSLGSLTVESKGVKDMKHGILSVGVAGGVVYFVNEHWGVEGMYRLSQMTLSEDDDHLGSKDMDGLSHSLTVGVVFSF